MRFPSFYSERFHTFHHIICSIFATAHFFSCSACFYAGIEGERYRFHHYPSTRILYHHFFAPSYDYADDLSELSLNIHRLFILINMPSKAYSSQVTHPLNFSTSPKHLTTQPYIFLTLISILLTASNTA